MCFTQVLQISPACTVGTCSPSSLTPALMPAQLKALSSESCARTHRLWPARRHWPSQRRRVPLGFHAVLPRDKTIVYTLLWIQSGMVGIGRNLWLWLDKAHRYPRNFLLISLHLQQDPVRCREMLFSSYSSWDMRPSRHHMMTFVPHLSQGLSR